MASRPIFVPAPEDASLVKVVPVELVWNPGFSVSQKTKNVQALHDAAARLGFTPVLEISTKSDKTLGRHLSAFHLKVHTNQGKIPLESAYQGSKTFAFGGPYTDLFGVDSRTAKRDVRLQKSGPIVAFIFENQQFPTEPKTAFYDWLYLNALFEHQAWLRPRLEHYAAFSDIEFNPQRSINCQAHACALFVALMKSDLLESALRSPEHFLATLAAHRAKTPHPWSIERVREP